MGILHSFSLFINCLKFILVSLLLHILKIFVFYKNFSLTDMSGSYFDVKVLLSFLGYFKERDDFEKKLIIWQEKLLKF